MTDTGIESLIRDRDVMNNIILLPCSTGRDDSDTGIKSRIRDRDVMNKIRHLSSH